MKFSNVLEVSGELQLLLGEAGRGQRGVSSWSVEEEDKAPSFYLVSSPGCPRADLPLLGQ